MDAFKTHGAPSWSELITTDPSAAADFYGKLLGWKFVFRRMDELGYTGWVGCEYRPAGDTVAGLKWRQEFGV